MLSQEDNSIPLP